MAILHGKWMLTAIGLDAGWKQSVMITGSTASDGIHEMVVGTVVGPVEGAGYEVLPYAWNAAANEWRPSAERTLMSYDEDKGIIVTIFADDNPGPAADRDFNDLVVECTSDERVLQPPQRREPPLDLTIPEQAIGHRSPTAPWLR